MTRIRLQNKDDSEHYRVTTGVDVFGDSPVNHALTAVAQEVAELLKQTYLVQADRIDLPAAQNRSLNLQPQPTPKSDRSIDSCAPSPV